MSDLSFSLFGEESPIKPGQENTPEQENSPEKEANFIETVVYGHDEQIESLREEIQQLLALSLERDQELERERESRRNERIEWEEEKKDLLKAVNIAVRNETEVRLEISKLKDKIESLEAQICSRPEIENGKPQIVELKLKPVEKCDQCVQVDNVEKKEENLDENDGIDNETFMIGFDSPLVERVTSNNCSGSLQIIDELLPSVTLNNEPLLTPKNEAQTSKQKPARNSRVTAVVNTLSQSMRDDDLFEFETSDRLTSLNRQNDRTMSERKKYARDSIGKWHQDREKNKMSVKDLVKSLERV